MFQKIKRCVNETDYILLIIAVMLSVFGVFAIYSAGYDPSTGDVEVYYIKQLIWIITGIFLFFIFSFINYTKIVRYALLIYLMGVLLLLLVVIAGYTGMGAKRWLDIGIIRIQPSEVFKIVWVISLAWIFINFDNKKQNIIQIIKHSLLLIPPFFLVFLQPDLGTALTYLVVWGCVIMFLGITRSTFIILLICMLVAVPTLWINMKDYQRKRVVTFINPEDDPFGAGYHIIQSKIGVGSGGINGKGYLKGTQSHLKFIPERHTDFIFSVINEEFGLIGGSIIIILFILILLRIFKIGTNSKESGGKILCIAVASYIFFQFAVNSCMTVGLMPVVGLPMPFVSYGGSSMMSFYIMLGLINSVHVRRFAVLDE